MLPMFTPNNHEPNGSEEISDQEWEIRTGRAIYILQRTLPDFFQVGLVCNVDPTKGPNVVNVSPLESGDVESIYSPKIRLSYTPPVALPSPFPSTLSLEGLPLYMASSAFIRRTMKTLYSDLRVELRKFAIQSPSTSTQINPAAVTHTYLKREKTLFISLSVYGTTRVSGGLGEWQIDSTYTFSPVSGLIHVHTINSIHPTPHQAAYDALRASLSSVFGIGGVGDIRPGELRAVDTEGRTRKVKRGNGR